jgi:hypothetical protein
MPIRAQVYSVDEATKAVVQLCPRVDLGGGQPVKLHGGALLGISFASTVSQGAELCRRPCESVASWGAWPDLGHLPRKSLVAACTARFGLLSLKASRGIVF